MGRRRPELTRNKRGTPVYSKEDIREQYCINEKEVHVLERITARSILNCFSERNPSPCKKQNLLTSCYKRKRKADYPEDSARPLPRPKKTWQSSDDDFDEQFFRRRPRVFCYTDPKRYTWAEGDLARGRRPRSPDSGRRPNQLTLREQAARPPAQGRRRNGSADDRVAVTQPSSPELGAARWRHASHDLVLDERHQKHVSFDSQIFRSQTMSSIDDPAGGVGRRQQPATPVRALNRSQERLLDGRRTPDYMDEGSNLFGPFLTKALLQEKMKRSSMRTQSTQTEANAAVEVAPPSYLSLSPRTVHKHLRSQGAQTQPRRRGHRALTKSYSEVGGRPSYLRRRPPPAEPVMARAVSSPIDIHPGEAAEPADSLPAANRRPVERRAAATGADRPPSQQEIMIDYKPCERKHPLQKTLSEGEILLDRRARERLATGCVEVSLVGLGGQRESVIEKLTVSESDLLEPSCGRLRALTQVQRLGPDLPPSPPLPPLPPPPPPRDYDDDEFHENLIENLLSEAVPRAESPSSGSESGEAATAGTRDALSPPRSTLTRDSLTESQETVLQAAGDTTPQPLPLPSDSEAGTPCAGPPPPSGSGSSSRSRSRSRSGSPDGATRPPAAEPENGAPSSASGSQPSLAREEARVLRQLDAISSELDHRLASPEELSRLSPPPPPPQLEGWKDTSPAPSYVSSVSEGDDDKRMEKFLMTLNEGFESDSTGQSDERNKSVSPAVVGRPHPVAVNGQCDPRRPASASEVVRAVPWRPPDNQLTQPADSEPERPPDRPRPPAPPSDLQLQPEPERPASAACLPADAAGEPIQPPSRVESLSSVSSAAFCSDASSRRDASGSTLADRDASSSTLADREVSDTSGPSDNVQRRPGAGSPRKHSRQQAVKRYSRFFEEDEAGQLVEVEGPGALAPSPSPDRSRTRRQLSKQFSVDEPQRGARALCLDLPGAATMYRVAETEPAAGRQRRRPEKSDRKNVRLELAEEMVSGWPAEAGDHERTAEDAAAPPPAEAEPAKLEERWAKKGAGVSSGMVRSPAMHEGFRPEEWSVVRTPQTPEKIVEVDERPAEKHGGDARKPHKEKKHKKRSKDRDKDASRGESSSRSRERTKNRDKTKQRSSKSPKRRSTVSDLVATEEVDPLSARGPEQKPALSSWDLRLSALGDDMVDRTLLSAKPSAESLRSVSPGSDNVFASSWQEGGAAPGAAGLRLARLDALSSDPPDTVQCSSCGERMRTPDAARTRSTSRERTPPREGGGEGEAEVGRGEGSPAEGRQKGPRPGEVDAPTLSEPAKSERHKKNLPEQPRDSTVGRPQPDLVPKEQPLEAGKRTKQPHTTEHRRPEAAAGGGPSKGARELQPGTAARERQTSRGSSRRRGADRADRVMSEERVLDPRPATQARAKSEERYTRDPLQTVSPRTSQDSLSRPTDASTQSTISMRELHEDEGGVYAGHFPAARWLYIGADEEMKVWRKKPRCESQPEACPESTLSRSPSVESTESEREFRRSYQAISHRMVHRKASGHMFKQMEDKSFAGDKSVVMQKCSGEFGFRIHGSRPVVVSAIEPGTPARLSGLEVGDIIISINGNRVLESSHGDVVKIAHAGSDQLKLEVASTSSVLATPESWSCVRQGPLWRRSGSASAWCRRWGVLKADASLYLFKRAEDVHPLAGLSLTDCTLNTSIDCDREMAFMVECEGAEPVALAAESAEEYENWLESLRTVIQESSSESAWQAAVRLNAAGPPGLIHNPDCGGFLSKLGHRWRCWKRLYCVLKDGVMYFYRGDSEPAAFGAAYLHGYRVQSSGVGGRRPSFEVSPPQPRLRHFYFIADSETERKRWLAALEYSIDRWIKVAH